MAIERILRRWSFESESVLPDDPAPFFPVPPPRGFCHGAFFPKTRGRVPPGPWGFFRGFVFFFKKVFRKTDEKLGSS